MMVSGLNATEKVPMYEMPLTYVFGGLGFSGWGEYFLYWGNGILSLAFCPRSAMSSDAASEGAAWT